MKKSYVLALDQGTTSSRAILYDYEGKVVKVAQKEFTQIYPKAGWVEHDPMEIWGSQSGVASELLATTGVSAEEIAAIGITNQRETTIVWDRQTGKPVYNAIVWQCRRTSGICDELKARGLEQMIRENTGLVIGFPAASSVAKLLAFRSKKPETQRVNGDLKNVKIAYLICCQSQR